MPALVLAAVAVGQMVVAWSSDLSPWKGGGFGMFSTIDSPGARVVRAYLVRGDEQIPVTIPDSLRELEMETRTHPTPERLGALATRLAAGTWVRYRLVPPSEHFRQLRSRFRSERGLGPDEIVIPTGAGSLAAAAFFDRLFEELGMLRMLSDEESPPEAEPFDAARVEVWRLTLDRPGRQLLLRRLRTAAVPRGG